MTGPRPIAVLLAILLLASVTLRTQEAPAPRGTAPPAPVQPLPYSHKKHVALGLDCRTCHVNPDPGKLMTFPPTTLCMGCHQGIAADRPRSSSSRASRRRESPSRGSGLSPSRLRVLETRDGTFAPA